MGKWYKGIFFENLFKSLILGAILGLMMFLRDLIIGI